MDELRWALLLLGVIVVLAVYVYTRRQAHSGNGSGVGAREGDRAEPRIRGEDLWGDDEKPVLGTRTEPSLSDVGPVIDDGNTLPPLEPTEDPLSGPAEVADTGPAIEQEPRAPADPGPTINPEKIVAMRVAAREGLTIEAEALVLKLREQGLRHGKFSIFHRHADEGSGAPLFSVASMTEPGSFDLSRLRETRLPGVTLFMVLPGPGDPVSSFDEMVVTARGLADELDGEVLDESGSTWSVQRERYIREELIQYRLQHPPRA